MVKRISVSISDELHSRLQLVKNSLKISKICQESISDAISQIELAESKDSKKLELLVNRLRKEKQRKLQPFYMEGFHDGQNDAYSIDLEQLEDYLYEEEVVDPFYPLDMLELSASPLTQKKHDAIYIASTYEEAEKELKEIDPQELVLSFFKLIEGDLVKKGFYNENNQPILEWDFLFMAKIYFEGWRTGMRTVIEEVKRQLYLVK
jgi:hypothetical protein